MDMLVEKAYMTAFKGSFTSTLRWPDLDEFWRVLKASADDGWYIYAVGEVPPENPVDKEYLLEFIKNVDGLLRKDHDEEYCGIVYVDNKQIPEFIKIFDPNNLGVSCGFSENPPLPGWVLSRIQPVELEMTMRPPKNRQRWWRRIFQK